MQDVVHACDGPLGYREVCEVALDQLHARDVRQVLSLTRDEAICDANTLAPSDELFREM